MKLGRPLEFDPDVALEKAMQVFWSQGYEATSLQNLLEAMDLSKSSFYQAFSNKQRLFERCIEHFRNEQVHRLRQALDQAPSGWAFLEQCLYALAEEARGPEKPRGCLIMNTATEFAGRDPAVAQQVATGIEKLTGVFVAAVQRAQAEGNIPIEHDAPVLARYLVSSISGLRTMVKAGARPETAHDIACVVMTALR